MASLTFGSVGDIIAICGLVVKTVSALSDSHGSSAQYQGLLREVRSLNSALQSASTVIEGGPHVRGSDQLRGALSSCYACLNSYLENITKYHESLNQQGSEIAVKRRFRQLQWQNRQDDVDRFRTEISSHILSIGTHLSTYSIQETRQREDDLKRYLESKFASFTTGDANRNLVLQMDATLQNRSLQHGDSFEKMFQALSCTQRQDELLDYGKFKDLVDRLEAMLEQKDIPRKLDRTWMQEPVLLDDALGRLFPIHLEFINSWEAFLFVLSGHFRGTPGEDKVAKREFLLYSTSGRAVDCNDVWHTAFRAGEEISMGITFLRNQVSRSSCPLCMADNDDPTDCEVQCKECCTKYRRIVDLSEEGSLLNDGLAELKLQPSNGGQTIKYGVPNPPERHQLEENFEPTEELHAYKRLVLKARIEHPSDAISQREVEKLINYHLANGRAEAIAMLLAKPGLSNSFSKSKEGGQTTTAKDKGSLLSPGNALIRTSAIDRCARQNMQDIVSLASTFSEARGNSVISSNSDKSTFECISGEELSTSRPSNGHQNAQFDLSDLFDPVSWFLETPAPSQLRNPASPLNTHLPVAHNDSSRSRVSRTQDHEPAVLDP